MLTSIFIGAVFGINIGSQLEIATRTKSRWHLGICIITVVAFVIFNISF